MRLAALSEGMIDFLVRGYGCTPGVIPAATYPQLQDGPVATAFVDTVFVATADLDFDCAYRITSALLANLEQLPTVHDELHGVQPVHRVAQYSGSVAPGRRPGVSGERVHVLTGPGARGAPPASTGFRCLPARVNSSSSTVGGLD